jgi:hypothetical protein
MEVIIYGLYLFLACFLAGNMTTLQFQHYAIYRYVGKENFKEYMQANNRSAVIPSILPAMLMLVVNIILFFCRPSFMSMTEVIISLTLNIIAFISTFGWQRKLQGEMAASGYDQAKISILNSTNWIRTIAFIIQAAVAVYIIIEAVNIR